MPTTKPRYTVTDTGEIEELLNAAQRLWPEIAERRVLLLRLAEEGGAALGLGVEQRSAEERGRRARAALQLLPSLIDPELLLSDQAWH